VPRDYWTCTARPALSFALPPSFFILFLRAWPRPGSCCAAHSSLSALRPLPDTMRKCGCPPLAWGVQIHLLRVRGTTKRLLPLFALSADPACHGHYAADVGTQLSHLQPQRGAAEYLAGLTWAKSGVRRGCSPPWKEESGHS